MIVAPAGRLSGSNWGTRSTSAFRSRAPNTSVDARMSTMSSVGGRDPDSSMRGAGQRDVLCPHVAAQGGGDGAGGGRVTGQQRPDVGATDPEEFTVRLAADGGRSGLVGQERHLAEEVPGAQRPDTEGGGFPRGHGPDRERAPFDDVEPAGRVALTEDN